MSLASSIRKRGEFGRDSELVDVPDGRCRLDRRKSGAPSLLFASYAEPNQRAKIFGRSTTGQTLVDRGFEAIEILAPKTPARPFDLVRAPCLEPFARPLAATARPSLRRSRDRSVTSHSATFQPVPHSAEELLPSADLARRIWV